MWKHLLQQFLMVCLVSDVTSCPLAVSPENQDVQDSFNGGFCIIVDIDPLYGFMC